MSHHEHTVFGRHTTSGDSEYMYSASISWSSGDPLLHAPNSADHLE